MKNGWIKQHFFSSQPYEKSWQAPKIFSLSINLNYSPIVSAVFMNIQVNMDYSLIASEVFMNIQVNYAKHNLLIRSI